MSLKKHYFEPSHKETYHSIVRFLFTIDRSKVVLLLWLVIPVDVA